MSVLVAYASRHGSTRGIAERVAARLRSAGLDTEVLAVGDVRRAEAYDAFVIGGAAYMFHWLKDATSFVRRHAALLASRSVWLFSSGPIGPDEPDAEGRDPRVTCIPREMPELEAAIRPRGTRIFFGAWDPAAKPIGVMERLTRMMPAARDAMPAGDFRDWPEIDAWADEIAGVLTAERIA